MASKQMVSGRSVAATVIASARGEAIDIGTSAEQRDAMAAGLSRLLADSYTLYQMTHNF